MLGEWEVTATVRETCSRASKEFSGPLMMKHVGLCTQDGPEEKTVNCAFGCRPRRIDCMATLSVAGEDCTYSASLSDA